MTDRLYYADSCNCEFDATVERVGDRDGRTLVTLNRTSFYPTSGGQPCDTGTIDAWRVVDVVDEKDGSIAHVIEDWRRRDPVDPMSTQGPAPRLAVGQTVHGRIDWARRFDHMQQHTGQHVLSAAFDRLFAARTVSFHLGAAAATIDLARDLTADDIAAGEDEANRIVWEDRLVTTRVATAEEAVRLPLRKESKREGPLRLIEVEDFDLSACGGTHVARTGAIGIIAVGSWERFKGGRRLEFFCGGRALRRFRSVRDTIASGVRLLSIAPEELPAAMGRLQAEAKEQARALGALQHELARYRSEELAASAEATDRGRLVLRAVDADANGLKALAATTTGKPGHVVVLVSTATPALVVVARSADVSIEAHQVLAALTTKFGGRGGGKPELAQGGGLDAAPDTILSAARAAILS